MIDWRGEALIRTASKPPAAPPDAPRLAARSVLTCAVPGCETRLSEPARSGVCRRHNHAPGLCRCQRCTEERV